MFWKTKKMFFQCHISLETVGNLFVFVSCWTLKEFLDEKEGWVVPLGDVKSWEKEKRVWEVKNKTVLMFIWNWSWSWIEIQWRTKNVLQNLGRLYWISWLTSRIFWFIITNRTSWNFIGSCIQLPFFKGYFVTFRIFIDFNFHEVFRFLECF